MVTLSHSFTFEEIVLLVQINTERMQTFVLCFPAALWAAWPPAQPRPKNRIIRRTSWLCTRLSSPPGTGSAPASTAAVTLSIDSLSVYQVKSSLLPHVTSLVPLAECFVLRVMQVSLINCRLTTLVTYAASWRLFLKSWQPSVNKETMAIKKVQLCFYPISNKKS